MKFSMYSWKNNGWVGGSCRICKFLIFQGLLLAQIFLDKSLSNIATPKPIQHFPVLYNTHLTLIGMTFEIKKNAHL